jgi:hypothetical protein
VGGRFVVRTDQNNLKYFLEQNDLSKIKHKWVSKWMIVVVDALSRRPLVFSLAEVSTDWKYTLLVEYSKNTFACELMEGTN